MDTLWHVFSAVDWRSMFVPSTSLIEIFLRGTLIYFGLLILLRVFKRQGGGIGMSDVLVIVLLADASQNGMAGEYKSVTEAGVLVFTIVGWDQFLDWLGFHVPGFQRLLRPRAVLLVKDGRIDHRAMRREMITREELMSQMREQGLLDVGGVKRAYMEGDGKISVICSDEKA